MAGDEVRTAEVVGSLCLATDLGMGLPFEHGSQSTVVAMRLANELSVDEPTAVQTYYGCLLFYAGCTTDADVQAALFPDGLTANWTHVMFASQRQSMAGVFRSLGAGEGGRVRRTLRAAAKFPRAGRGYKHHTEALCEVAEMLGVGIGLPPSVSGLFRLLTERWDGGGPLGRAAGADLPLAIRIVHVPGTPTSSDSCTGRLAPSRWYASVQAAHSTLQSWTRSQPTCLSSPRTGLWSWKPSRNRT